MAEEKKMSISKHNIIMENRELINISGVEDVDSFDENEVIIYTNHGDMVVYGENLHINKLSVDSGEVEVEGTINGVEYKNVAKNKGGFFSKLMK